MAFVELPVSLTAPAEGHAEIVTEVPNELTLAVDMKTAGCLVVADCWAAGWKALYNKMELPVLRVNHALRGVILPAGKGTLVLRV